MGLDQYAYAITDESGDEGANPAFQWRKHAKLQRFMEDLFKERTGQSSDELNCGELRLTETDITDLRAKIEQEDLPQSAGGFFYGHQYQDESARGYHAQDLAFCAWALEQMSDGATVAYSCWW